MSKKCWGDTMKLKCALLLIIALSVLTPIIAIQLSSQVTTAKPTLKMPESPIVSCGVMKPNDPGSGGGGRGET